MKIGREAPLLTLRDTWKSRQMQKKIETAMRKKSTKGKIQRKLTREKAKDTLKKP